MPLRNTTIRRTFGVLVAVPVVLAMALSSVVVVNRIEEAGRAGDVVHAMTAATQVGGVIDSLEREEVTAVGYLLGIGTAADLDAASAQVSDRAADLVAQLGDALPEPVRSAVERQAALDPVRQAVSSRTGTPAETVDAYSMTIDSIITALALPTEADTATPAGHQVLALDALLRIDALHTAGAADLLIASAQRTQPAVIAYAAAQGAVRVLEGQLEAYASAAQMDLYGLVTTSFVERVGPSFATNFVASPRAAVATLSPAALYPQLGSYLQLGSLVQAKITADVTAAERDQQRTNLTDAYIVGGGAILIVLLVILLSWLTLRSVSRSFSGLASAVNRAADRGEAELRRVAEDHAETVEHVQVDALPVGARSEIGEFARAFVRAQRAPATIVESQAAARRNLTQMTANAGRRGAHLVARQLAIIAQLQRAADDPQMIDELDRLDHVTGRLRRVTAGLVTLSDAGETGRHAADESGYVTPMALVDLVGLALGEIDTDTPVDIRVAVSTMVAPAVVDDVVLLFAELIANAAAFSPTGTRVRVVSRPYDSGVSVVDEGVGMSDEQLATQNARAARAERLDLASSGALGLFLVGRLARRHDLRVTFEHTPGGGVTVIVDLGHHVTTVAPADTARATAPVVPTAYVPRPRVSSADVTADAPRVPSLSPMPQLASRPFNLAAFEQASRVLKTGASWDAFAVLPSHAALPAGRGVPELPGASTRHLQGSSGDLAHPPGDLPRAGTGFTHAAPGTVGPSYTGTGDDVPHPGGPYAHAGRPFERAAAHPFGEHGPFGEAGPFGGRPTFHADPFEDGDVTFPAGGIARYVAPDPTGEDTARGGAADDARNLVEQFEIGVARALGETAADGIADGGRGR